MKQKNNRRLGSYFPYLLIFPTVFLILLFMFYPITQVLNLSIQDYSTNSFSGVGQYIGLDNFKKLLTDDKVFGKAFFISIKWVAAEIVGQVILGMCIALLLNQKVKCRGLFRSIAFMPWAVSGVLATMLWTIMYNQHVGVINDLLLKAGILKEGVAWLSNPNTAFWAVVVSELWRGVPFFAITLLAGLQSISQDIYESCDIDGCSPIQKFRYITLPFLKETLTFSILLRCIWEFNSIDLIFTMTNGGPLRLTTTVPVYLMQQAVVGGKYGYGSAMAVLMAGGLLLFAVIYLKVTKYGREEL
ncbi:MAG: sugar ABC transporter permease [Clostridiales bacterium]|nr:sugar ABC transporter permease [Clostridiales bacterium]